MAKKRTAILAPCPFCGGTAGPWQVDDYANCRYSQWRVECDHWACEAAGPWRDKEAAAVEGWNTRVDGCGVLTKQEGREMGRLYEVASKNVLGIMIRAGGPGGVWSVEMTDGRGHDVSALGPEATSRKALGRLIEDSVEQWVAKYDC